jgi:hypothetical protein
VGIEASAVVFVERVDEFIVCFAERLRRRVLERLAVGVAFAVGHQLK